MDSIAEARSLLSDTADRLAGEIDFPVSVRLICNCLNVRIRRRTELKAAVLVNANDGPEVHLPRPQRNTSRVIFSRTSGTKGSFGGKPNGSESWERYVVAHELGHYVLHRARHGKPLGKSEYWIHEELCDSFARWLLLPQKALEKWFSRRLESLPHISPEVWARSSLAMSKELQGAARVPWSIAATRISEYSERIAFLGIRNHDTTRLRVNCSTLHSRKEIGRLILKSSELGQILSSEPMARIVSVPPGLFVGFPSLPMISAAAAQRTGPAQWHLGLALK